MKKYLSIITILISLNTVSCSIESKGNNNYVFLNFYLGMTEKDYIKERTSLMNTNHLFFKELKNTSIHQPIYYYNFKLKNGKVIPSKLKPYFKNKRLIKLTLTFVSFSSNEGVPGYLNLLVDKNSLDEIYNYFEINLGKATKRSKEKEFSIWKQKNNETLFYYGIKKINNRRSGAKIEWSFYE